MDWPWRSPNPFFAGAAAGAGALAGLACGRRRIDFCVQLEHERLHAFLFVLLVDSLISTFWKYPDRFIAVMKLATELIEADEPSMLSVLPLRVIVGQPQIFRARNRVGHHVQQFLPAGAVALQLLDRVHALLQNLSSASRTLPPAA